MFLVAFNNDFIALIAILAFFSSMFLWGIFPFMYFFYEKQKKVLMKKIEDKKTQSEDCVEENYLIKGSAEEDKQS